MPNKKKVDVDRLDAELSKIADTIRDKTGQDKKISFYDGFNDALSQIRVAPNGSAWKGLVDSQTKEPLNLVRLACHDSFWAGIDTKGRLFTSFDGVKWADFHRQNTDALCFWGDMLFVNCPNDEVICLTSYGAAEGGLRDFGACDCMYCANGRLCLITNNGSRLQHYDVDQGFSTRGGVWRTINLKNFSFNSVVSIGTQYVAVDKDKNKVMTSIDGLDWTARKAPADTITTDVQRAFISGTMYCFVGTDNGVWSVSEDELLRNLAWDRPNGSLGKITQLVFGNQLRVAVNDAGEVYYNDLGDSSLSWKKEPSLKSVVNVAYGNGAWIIMKKPESSGGPLVVEARYNGLNREGTTTQLAPKAGSNYYDQCVYHNGVWILMGENLQTMYSIG